MKFCTAKTLGGMDLARDMTQGNLAGNLIRFSIPLILSGLLQQLYNWADAFIVGHVEGELALGAIGATGVISNLFVTVITGFTVGLTVQTAQYYGRGERERMKDVLSSFVLVVGSLFLAAGLLAVWQSGNILRLMDTPEDLFEIALDYLRTVLLGVPFLAVYNVYSAVLRGMGDSKAPFFSIIVSAVSNVVLDLLFVGWFRWGAWGAALATVLAQGLMTAFLVCYTVRRYAALRFWIGRRAVNGLELCRGAALGVPTAIQSSISSCGGIILQNFMNGFGTATVTAITTAYRVDLVMMLPILNLGSGISTVAAQNLGAGDIGRARKALSVGLAMETVISLLLTVLMATCGGALIAMFGVSGEAEEIGRQFFRSIAGFYLAFGLSTALRGYLEGIGDVLFTSMASIAALGSRILLSYGLAEPCGMMIIAYAEGISWIVLVLVNLARYAWKRRSVVTIS